MVIDSNIEELGDMVVLKIVRSVDRCIHLQGSSFHEGGSFKWVWNQIMGGQNYKEELNNMVDLKIILPVDRCIHVHLEDHFILIDMLATFILFK